MKHTFELTDDHLKLIKRLYFDYEDCGYGGIPQIDGKRPFGNSSIECDVAEILDWELVDDEFPDEYFERATEILEELAIAIQICTSNLTFETGTYVKDNEYNDLSWRKEYKVIIKMNNDVEYPDDCERIQKILLSKGYKSTLKDCEELWKKYSDTYAAGWLYLDDDDEDV